MRAYIFDLDGTLIDSLADINDAINLMLTEHGYPTVPLDIFPQYFGDGARALVERVLPKDVLNPHNIDARLADYQRHYATTWQKRTSLFDGVSEMLSELENRQVTLAVLSNKPNHYTQLCTRHFMPKTPFVTILGARDGVPRKPDPTAALEIMNQFGLAPEECAYIGDSGIDMAMANRAGMYAVGVRWGFGNEEELETHGADIILSHPRELLDLKR